MKKALLLALLVSFSLGICELGFALTLKESVDLAASNNPQLRGAEKRLGAADARLNQARSQFMPSLSLDASIGRSYSQPMEFSMPAAPGGTPETLALSPDEATNLTSYSFTLRQLLFTGGKDWNGYAMANYNYLQAKEDLRRTRLDVSFKVIQAYYDLIKAKKAHDLAQERMANLKRYVAQSEMFYNADLITKADVLRVETELASSAQLEIQTESAEKIAKISFNSLIGKALTEEVAVSEGETLSYGPTLEPEALLKIAYERRPDWISVRLAEETAKSGVNVAWAGYFPTISLLGSYGRNGTEYPDTGLKYDLENWRAMLSASWTLFDGLLTPNKVYEANANLEAMQADISSMKDGIAVEVTSAYYDLQAEKKRVDAASGAQDMAKKLLHFAELNYNAHIGTSLQVLDAETAFHKAEMDQVSAQYDLELAKAKLNKAIGAEII